MTYEEAAAKILSHFADPYGKGPMSPESVRLRDTAVECRKRDSTYVIDVSQMYDHPELYKPNGSMLDAVVRLSDTFGTDKVDVENGESNSGCETCDYGSSYGTVLTITNPTKAVDVLDALCGGPKS